MDRSDIITLIKTTYTQDSAGVMRKSERPRAVYCQTDSVSRDEFFEGGRSGLNPSYRFTIFAYDYDDEAECKYKGQRYGIYRTYVGRNDTLELYVERKGGTNGGDNTD